jgi:hypothetical protein
MAVLEDPDGGYYWWCPDCQTGLDTIELYARVKHRGDVRRALDDVFTLPEFGLQSLNISDAAFESYIQNFVDVRRLSRTWSQKSQRRYAQGSGLYDYITSSLNITRGALTSSSKVMEEMGRWLHGVELDEAGELLNCGQRPQVFGKFLSCLGLACGPVPGRINALLLASSGGQCTLWSPPYRNITDHGIGMYDSLKAYNPVIYALRSPWLALALQKMHFAIHSEPAPIVFWTAGTDPSVWKRLYTDKIIFWDFDLTGDLLKHAMEVPGRSYISAALMTGQPQKAESFMGVRDMVRDEYRDYTSDQLLGLMREQSQDASLVFCNWLLGSTDEKTSELLDSIHLTTGQEDRLLQQCPDAESRQLLQQKLSHCQPQIYRTIRKRRAVQINTPNSNAWAWDSGPRGHEIISECTMHHERTIIHKGVHYYAGHIRFMGQEYEFCEKADEIRRVGPADFMTKHLESLGCPTPRVSRISKPVMLDFMQQFSGRAETIIAMEKVGWTDDRSTFNCPHVAISHGDMIKQTLKLVPEEHYPLCRTSIEDTEISDDTWEAILMPLESVAACWSILAAVAANTMAAVSMRSPRGIGLVGELSRKIGHALAYDANMLFVRPEDVDEAPQEHDVPVYVSRDMSKDNMTNQVSHWINHPCAKNALVPMKPSEASSAWVTGQWTLVHADEKSANVHPFFPFSAILMQLIAWLQQPDNIPRVDLSPARSALRCMEKMAQEKSDHNVTAVIRMADSMLMDNADQTSLALRFLYMVYQLLQDGHIKRHEYKSVTNPGTTTIVIDEESDEVFIGRSDIIHVLRRLNYPTIQVSEITDSMRADGILVGEGGTLQNGWIIKKPAWDENFRVWKGLQSRLGFTAVDP